MEPTRQHQKAFDVWGLGVRTTNAEEMDPLSGRIPALWGRFFTEDVMGRTSHRSADPRNFGVYSGYESDAHGPFDVTVGVGVTHSGTVRIEESDYLVFDASGELPLAVLAAWQRVWQYFEQHPQVKRRYRSDFEAYSGPTQAAIYIGVE